MNFKKMSLGLLAVVALASCKGGTSASTPVPDVTAKGCIKESELMKAGIVGGEKVTNFDVDSKKVVLLYAEDENGKASICTATPIAPNVLLTAAHCIGKRHLAMFYSSLSCESGFDVEKHAVGVRLAIKHEDWNEDSSSESNSAKDVAVVVLEDSIPSSYRVSKIANPADVDFNNGAIRFIGYGVVDYKAGGSGILRKTEIPVINARADVTKNLVYVDQSSGHGVCSGDSGGPSLVRVNGQEQILGVNSVVSGSSKATLCREESIQTLASGHIPWIKKSLAQYGININL